MGGYRIRVSKEIHELISERALQMGVTPETVIARLILCEQTSRDGQRAAPGMPRREQPVMALSA